MVTLSYSQTVEGLLETAAGGFLRDIFPVDHALANDIWRSGGPLQISALGYGATTGEFNRLLLDWGTHVPLRFIQRWHPEPFPVIILTPSRVLSLTELFAFGEHLGTVLQQHPKRTAIIASGDLSHTHLQTGPYGFHPEAARMDRWFLHMLSKEDWPGMCSVTPERLNKAKPDAFWQLAVAAGALSTVPHQKFMLQGYSCPTYFGMASAFTGIA
jgi:aromatic ring-opening dioxygenase LigB subunit